MRHKVMKTIFVASRDKANRRPESKPILEQRTRLYASSVGARCGRRVNRGEKTTTRPVLTASDLCVLGNFMAA